MERVADHCQIGKLLRQRTKMDSVGRGSTKTIWIDLRTFLAPSNSLEEGLRSLIYMLVCLHMLTRSDANPSVITSFYR